MVGDKTTKQQQDNLADLEVSLAPAEAEFGAVAKADQYYQMLSILQKGLSYFGFKRLFIVI